MMAKECIDSERPRGLQELAASLRNEFVEILAKVTVGARHVAILGFPHHRNPGDAAIWLGERHALRSIGLEVATVCDWTTYSPSTIRRRLGSSGMILMQGGGNLGDTWPELQEFTERVVSDFGSHRIVILPQSARFESAERLSRARAIMGAHNDLLVLVRDPASLQVVSGDLACDALLSPDAAFALAGHPSLPARAPVIPVLAVARKDREKGADWADGIASVASCDWDCLVYRKGLWATCGVGVRVGRVARRQPMAHALVERAFPPMFDAMARDIFGAAADLIASCETLHTDRLHAHIIATLLGVPSIVYDNSYGKVVNFVGLWTSGAEGVEVREG